MFIATISGPSIQKFKKVIEATKEINDLVSINLTENGIDIYIMDSSNIMVCFAHFDKSEFTKIEYDHVNSLNIYLNINDLFTVLRIGSDESEVLTLSYEDKCKLYLDFDDKTFYEIRLIDDIDYDIMENVEKEFACSYLLNSMKFSKNISNYTLIGSCLEINVNTLCSEITFKINDKSNLSCTDDIKPIQMFKNKQNIKQRYNLKYISKFIKSSFLSENVLIKLDNNEPLSIMYGTKESSYIQYYMAPMVATDADF